MMQTALIIGAAAALANGAAMPIPAKQFFTLPQSIAKPLPAGPIAMQNTYHKYGKAHVMPADVKAAAAAQTGTVAANNQAYDQSYLSPVTVGQQTLNLDFDTGSSDLWVFSTSLPSSERGSHKLYTNSGTRQSGETWKIGYGDGSGASGVVYSDRVVIGGVTATSQAVEAATSVSSEFVSDTSDGLVGLAMQSINTCQPNQCGTFMTTVGNTLQSDLFAATLKKGKPGSYDFGYIDSSKYTGSLAYTSVNTANGFWEFTVSGYSVGSAGQTSSSIDLIADTGTSLIYLPSAAVRAYYSKVSGASYSSSQGGYIFPCGATLPNFSVYFAGAKHTVPGSYINYAPVSSSSCFGGIQSNSGLGISILGDTFLKSQYVVFDVGNTRIGFAQQAGVST